ncbi:unnamed protein product, partial [marine sediment metagenome]
AHIIEGVARWPVPPHLPARALVRRWHASHFDRSLATYDKT